MFKRNSLYYNVFAAECCSEPGHQPRPAGKHLENIYAKLGVANRASLIAVVHR